MYKRQVAEEGSVVTVTPRSGQIATEDIEEMCIRDSFRSNDCMYLFVMFGSSRCLRAYKAYFSIHNICLLYTSDKKNKLQ